MTLIRFGAHTCGVFVLGLVVGALARNDAPFVAPQVDDSEVESGERHASALLRGGIEAVPTFVAPCQDRTAEPGVNALAAGVLKEAMQSVEEDRGLSREQADRTGRQVASLLAVLARLNADEAKRAVRERSCAGVGKESDSVLAFVIAHAPELASEGALSCLRTQWSNAHGTNWMLPLLEEAEELARPLM